MMSSVGQFGNAIDKLSISPYARVMLIQREIGESVLRRSRKYPVVSITGPRQSGKTTLAKMLFPDHEYISLERPDFREQAEEDPNRFLRLSLIHI